MSEGSGKKEGGVTDVRINVMDGHRYMSVMSEDIEDDEFLSTNGHIIREKFNRPVPLHVCIFLSLLKLTETCRAGLCRQFAKKYEKYSNRLGSCCYTCPKNIPAPWDKL